LGFRVLQDAGKCFLPGSPGEYGCACASNTSFCIDPVERFIGILMTQFQPNGYHLVVEDFRVLAYQALID
ncbi:MAG: hypothetical protein K8S00_01435, partial [Bacteroidales bacterium]|nr:hypothetical protein [Bacteroidales bacterium]